MVPACQEFRNGLAERFWLSSLTRLQLGCRLGYSGSHTHMAGKFILAVGGRPHHVDLFTGPLERPHDMASGFPQSHSPKRARWKPQCLLCSSIIAYTLSLLQNLFGNTSQQVISVHCREGQPWYEHREARLTGGYLGDWMPYLSFSSFLFLPETETPFDLFPLDGFKFSS